MSKKVVKTFYSKKIIIHIDNYNKKVITSSQKVDNEDYKNLIELIK